MMALGVEAGLQDWVKSRLADAQIEPLKARPWSEARLYCVQSEGALFALKIHQHALGFAQEIRAYEQWFGVDCGVVRPGLVATCAEHHALLLSWVDGVDGDDETLGVQRCRLGLKRAGELIVTLANLAKPDIDQVDLAAAMSLRLRAWTERALGQIADHWIEWVDATVDCSIFVGVSRVPAHRDLQPRNWIHHNDEVVFLDWGHARYDAPMTDWVKLVCGAARRCPGGHDALRAGFGRPLSTRQCARLYALCVLHGLCTATWAAQHSDQRAREHGIETLHWLKVLGLRGFVDLMSAASSFV